MASFNQSKIMNATTNTESSGLAEFVYNHMLTLRPMIVQGTVADSLRVILQSIGSNEIQLNIEFTENVMHNYFDMEASTTKEEKRLQFTVEVIVKAAIVLYQSKLPEYIFDNLTTVEELLIEYPSFMSSDIDSIELRHLLTFRNMMKIALELIPGHRNKRLLLDICSILEGSKRTYSTGGTQSLATTRRIKIYEQESNKQEIIFQRRLDNDEKIKRTTITCICGSRILKRTIWKHGRSLKHTTFVKLRGEKNGSDNNCEIYSDNTIVSKDLPLNPTVLPQSVINF